MATKANVVPKIDVASPDAVEGELAFIKIKFAAEAKHETDYILYAQVNSILAGIEKEINKSIEQLKYSCEYLFTVPDNEISIDYEAMLTSYLKERGYIVTISNAPKISDEDYNGIKQQIYVQWR